ncbi:MAG: hypothetical protein ABIV28_02210 [Longimicrobiales bacterium]
MSNNMIQCRILAAAICASIFAFPACYGAINLEPNDAPTVLSRQLLQAPDPSQPGTYSVRHLYYGSGTDKQRSVYRDSVAFKTNSVDMSKLVSIDPPQAKDRKNFFGFEPKSFPIQARVWYPEGAGKFPLVLVVHGNHLYTDFSDPGYEYLGQLLASRGYILASVDMNFINGLRRENDGRGAMLLEHVRAWKGFNADTANPFYGKVDFENIALIGHSRGGEAVGHAAAFNRMSRYPDDANVKFDYNFPIKAIIAIAPVDGQYKPSDRFEPVENVDYLVFHGSHDGDVSTFHGLRQYQRVQFNDGGPHIKSAVYVYRANHGQWNTVWNNHDNGPRSGRILDLRGLLSGAEQRQFANVYVSAFLDAALKHDKRYLPMFRDHRVAGSWLPKTMYTTRFADETFRTVADFEDDVDVTTGSSKDVTLMGDSLSSWKEAAITYRSTARAGGASDPQNNQAVWIGWNNRLAGKDTTKYGPHATYSVTLSDSVTREMRIDRNSAFMFDIAVTDTKPGPRAVPDTTKKDTTAAGKSAAAAKAAADKAKPKVKEPKERKKPEPKKPPLGDTTAVEISVEATDAVGNTARVALSRYGVLRHPLDVKVLRLNGADKANFATTYEVVLQTFSIPLSDFTAANASFDPTRLRRMSFVFTPTQAGTVVLDQIGFAKLDPAYTTARF